MFVSNQEINYRMAENFCMVQNFTVFVDRVATAKIKTTKILVGGEKNDIIMKLTHCMVERLIERSFQPC